MSTTIVGPDPDPRGDAECPVPRRNLAELDDPRLERIARRICDERYDAPPAARLELVLPMVRGISARAIDLWRQATLPFEVGVCVGILGTLLFLVVLSIIGGVS